MYLFFHLLQVINHCMCNDKCRHDAMPCVDMMQCQVSTSCNEKVSTSGPGIQMAQQPLSGHLNMLASQIWSPEKSPGMGPSAPPPAMGPSADPLAAVSGDTDLASRMVMVSGHLKKPGRENPVTIWMWCACGVQRMCMYVTEHTFLLQAAAATEED